MNSFFESLKKKGPGGVPLWAYAAGTVAILYLGYRFFKGRGGSGSGSSSQDQSANSVDTSGDGFASPGYVGDPGGGVDTIPPDTTTDTNPPAGDSTGIINGPENIGEPPPKKKKKAHKTPHDHKQGTHHTNKKPIFRRKPGHKQTPHAHAPKVSKRPPSHEKAKVNRAVPATAAQATRRITAITPPPVRESVKVGKSTPPPVKRLPEEPRIVAKAPPKTKRSR